MWSIRRDMFRRTRPLQICGSITAAESPTRPTCNHHILKKKEVYVNLLGSVAFRNTKTGKNKLLSRKEHMIGRHGHNQQPSFFRTFKGPGG